jgi:hypothetical protein
MAHVFVTERRELSDHFGQLRDVLAPDGTVWVNWPKKSAKVQTDITEDVVREEALSLVLSM